VAWNAAGNEVRYFVLSASVLLGSGRAFSLPDSALMGGPFQSGMVDKECLYGE
jgi:hypothetical protein